MHEATRRVLGVLLRHLDGFDSTNKRTVVIGATNRKQVGGMIRTCCVAPSAAAVRTTPPVLADFTTACACSSLPVLADFTPACLPALPRPPPRLPARQDLDPALISRFSTSVNFGLPSEPCRCVQPACGAAEPGAAGNRHRWRTARCWSRCTLPDASAHTPCCPPPPAVPTF